MSDQNMPCSQRIEPAADIPLLAVDNARRYSRCIIVCLAVELMSLFLLLVLHKVCFMVMVLAGFCCAFRLALLYKKEVGLITDIGRSFLSVEEDEFICVQTAGNRYEECRVCYDEIERAAANEKECGFYFWLRDDAERSMIFVDGMMVKRNIFYVSGSLYDTGEFISLFEHFVDSLPEGLSPGMERAGYRAWYPKKQGKLMAEALFPWIFAAAAVMAQVLLDIL